MVCVVCVRGLPSKQVSQVHAGGLQPKPKAAGRPLGEAGKSYQVHACHCTLCVGVGVWGAPPQVTPC